jgi:hypothetical protein
MIGRMHRIRTPHLIDIRHYREHVTGARGPDSFRKRGERANVNHGGPFVVANISLRTAR